MKILIAPNAFKNSLDAMEVALAIQEGLQASRLTCACTCFPVADGGDGTGKLILIKQAGKTVVTTVQDALGRTIETSMGFIDKGKTAVIEMADAAGIRWLQPHELAPLIASSYGTGQQIKAALDRGVKKIIVGMGGSATVDGGAGMLRALGIRFLNRAGDELPNLPGSLTELAHIDTSRLDQRVFNCEIVVLCDVDNPLLGAQGAAAVFGPQKGANPEAVSQLDAALARLAAITLEVTGKNMAAMPHSGTAGGAAAGLAAFINASLVNGIDYFLELTGFEQALAGSNLVITGEGSIDEQTLNGKGPFGVAVRAKARQLPVIAFAGKLPLHHNNRLHEYFDVLRAIGNEPSNLETAFQHTRDNLIRVARQTGDLLCLYAQ